MPEERFSMEMKIAAAVFTRLIQIVCLVFVVPIDAFASEFRARIDRVVDGDTLVAITEDGRSLRLRLADIDAPEKDQRWGTEATQMLSKMALGRSANVRVEDTDRYGRLVATVFVNEKNVNRAMVRDGHAWVYRKYLRDLSLPNLEATAKRGQRGLWVNTDAIEPSRWRRGDRHTRSQLGSSSLPEPPVKKSRSNICHEAGSEYYSRVKHFEEFKVLKDCIDSGGRLPKARS